MLNSDAPDACSSRTAYEATREATSRSDGMFVFANPSVGRLASHLVRCMVGAEALPSDPKAEMEKMIAKYAIGLEDEVASGDGVLGRFRRRHVLFVEWFDGWTGFVSAGVLVES